jgi:prevent-host-death family protein
MSILAKMDKGETMKNKVPVQKPGSAKAKVLRPGVGRPSTVKEGLPRAGRPSVSYPSTQVKNQFGKIMDEALSGKAVFITSHAQPKAVLLSMAEYTALVEGAKRALQTLTSEYDSMVASMQTAPAQTAITSLFSASGDALGQAALDAKRPE